MGNIAGYLENTILEDLNNKMVFMANPRQCGKTTLAKKLLKANNPVMFIECKSSPGKRHRGLSYLKGKYPEVQAVQIDIQTTSDTISPRGIRHVSVNSFLEELI